MNNSTTRKQSQRKSLSCTQCARRKLRCSKTIPCLACIDRGNASLCQRRDQALQDSSAETSSATRRSKRQRIEYGSHHSPSITNRVLVTPQASEVVREHHIQSSRSSAIPLNDSTSSEASSPTNDPSTVNDLAPDVPVTLEFLALSRRRVLRTSFDLHGESVNTTDANIEKFNPILSPEQLTFVLDYHRANLSWTHNVLHLPTFQEQCQNFLKSRKLADKSWPALYYSVLSMSFYHMQPAILANVGIHDPTDLAEAVYQMSLDHLRDIDFMANHHVSSVQAICLLIYVGHNLGQSDRHCVLLASAIRIAQCLGMHRLGSDGSHHIVGLDALAIQQALIDREVQKRTWWFLIRQDWLQIPYVNTYTVHPSQFNTPMPLNCCDDQDLMVENNRVTEMEKDVYTQGSFTSVLNSVSTLIWKMQDRMCRLGHPHKSEDGLRRLYEEVLRADAQLKKLMQEMPGFYHDNVDESLKLPQHVSHQRQVMSLTLAHKFYSIHRHFQVLSFKDPWYAYSKMSCLSIALHSLPPILSLPQDEYTHIAMNLWTVNTQTITALIWIIFELLFTSNDAGRVRPATDLRRIVQQTLKSLESRQSRSRIARNGVRVIRYLSEIDNTSPGGTNKAFGLEDIIAYVRSGETEQHDAESQDQADWDTCRLEEWIPFGDASLHGYQGAFDASNISDHDFESPPIRGH